MSMMRCVSVLIVSTNIAVRRWQYSTLTRRCVKKIAEANNKETVLWTWCTVCFQSGITVHAYSITIWFLVLTYACWREDVLKERVCKWTAYREESLSWDAFRFLTKPISNVPKKFKWTVGLMAWNRSISENFLLFKGWSFLVVVCWFGCGFKCDMWKTFVENKI